jgi:hypothetical protein
MAGGGGGWGFRGSGSIAKAVITPAKATGTKRCQVS